MSIRDLNQNEIDQVSGGALITQYVPLNKSVTSVLSGLKVGEFYPNPEACWCGTCIAATEVAAKVVRS